MPFILINLTTPKSRSMPGSTQRCATQKATGKTPRTSDKEDVVARIAYCVPSVTQSSGIKILWKGISGSYRSVKKIEPSRTLTEVKHEALRLYDAFQEQAHAVRNRTYITYIARKRIKHSLSINKSSGFTVFVEEYQPLDGLCPTLARDIMAQPTKDIECLLCCITGIKFGIRVFPLSLFTAIG
ncbi:unnamed protein product [Fusarium graminearum]|uniref:Uncharacterized protein n=1 Tax=Gibberella zeae TaxID=5518 RepID=A0A4E9DHW2_GIBZA|nr:unnamed protein product [Fusarium graminearum]